MTLLHYFFDLTLFREKGRNPYKKFVGFLVDLKTPKGHFEINWPLTKISSRKCQIIFLQTIYLRDIFWSLLLRQYQLWNLKLGYTKLDWLCIFNHRFCRLQSFFFVTKLHMSVLPSNDFLLFWFFQMSHLYKCLLCKICPTVSSS